MQALMGDLVGARHRRTRDRKPAHLQEIVEILRSREAELRRRGIGRLFIFGSTAREENTDESDIDLLVEMNDEPLMSLTKFANLKLDIEDILGHPVDLVEKRLLKPTVAAMAAKDAVRVF